MRLEEVRRFAGGGREHVARVVYAASSRLNDRQVAERLGVIGVGGERNAKAAFGERQIAVSLQQSLLDDCRILATYKRDMSGIVPKISVFLLAGRRVRLLDAAERQIELLTIKAAQADV